jgi:hypothetical protein
MQTDPIADQSAGTQTNFTMCNTVTNYIDILKVFSPKSKVVCEPEYVKSRFFGIKNPTCLSDTDLSDEEIDLEEELNFTICACKRTMPAALCPSNKKAKILPPTSNPSTSTTCNVDEDLALSSSSIDDSMDEVANLIERNII